MKFIDALYEYEEITRDNEEIFYLKDDILYCRLVDCAKSAMVVPICDLEEIFTHTDWYEYKENNVPHLRVNMGESYYYVGHDLSVVKVTDKRIGHDDMLFNSGNYFRNKEDAQHLADTFKRLSLIINTKRYNTERDILDIIRFIDKLYPSLKRDMDRYNKEYML